MNDEKVSHSLQPSTFNGDLAIVWARNETRQNPVDAPISCNDANLKRRRPKTRNQTIWLCSQLHARWTVDPMEQWPTSKLIDHFATVIRRAQHDQSLGIGQR